MKPAGRVDRVTRFLYAAAIGFLCGSTMDLGPGLAAGVGTTVGLNLVAIAWVANTKDAR